MNLHANAALSLNRRRQLCWRVVDERWTLRRAAEAAEGSVRRARKWVGRYRAEGELGLLDRSSAPGSIPHRTGEERVQAIAALRRLRFTGPEIAETLGMALSTVSGISSCLWLFERLVSASPFASKGPSVAPASPVGAPRVASSAYRQPYARTSVNCTQLAGPRKLEAIFATTLPVGMLWFPGSPRAPSSVDVRSAAGDSGVVVPETSLRVLRARYSTIER